MDANEMKARTKAMGLRVMKLIDSLPDSVKGRAIANQIVRSATSVGANYRAALRGRSKKEFVAKIGVALEECDETAYWLELIAEGDLLPTERVENLRAEADELCAILFSVRRSSSENDQSQIPNDKWRWLSRLVTLQRLPVISRMLYS